jgi:5-methylthioadenosine/S-adenosylhomocysteine deaminase
MPRGKSSLRGWWTPYAGTRLAAAEAADAGITTVHDWSHNIRGRQQAEEGLRALAESGLRARFSYGYEAVHPNSRLMALDDLADLASTWPSGHRARVRPGDRGRPDPHLRG